MAAPPDAVTAIEHRSFLSLAWPAADLALETAGRSTGVDPWSMEGANAYSLAAGQNTRRPADTLDEPLLQEVCTPPPTNPQAKRF